jgi:predicted nucleotidyltransferase
MNLQELRTFKPQIQAFARQYHIDPDSIRVFGSVARGDQTINSDVDLLIRLLPEANLFDLSGFNYEVNHLLGMHVDTAPDESLYPQIAKFIADDVTYL